MKDIVVQPMTVALVAVALGVFYVLAYFRERKYQPPGPRGLPIIGNLLQMPQQHLATYFRSLIKTYGDLVYLNVVGIPIILIGNMDLAKEILERRAVKFSSRPKMSYMHDNIDPNNVYWATNAPQEGYQLARRLTVATISPARFGVTEPLQHFESLLTIQHLLNDGSSWSKNVERMATSTILTAAFGAHCPTGNEETLIEAKFIVDELTSVAGLSASITNFLPFLNRIPGPMPWRTRADAFRRRHDKFFSTLIEDAVSGKACRMNTWAASFAGEGKSDEDRSRLTIQFVAAGYETTVTTLKLAILAFILNPEKVMKAQKQLDDIVGLDRLPTFADRPKVPYIEAMIREVLRWRPAVRVGIPHLSTVDDVIEYNGAEYFLPSGSIVFALPWAIEHNPEQYHEPDRFEPERYLDHEGNLRIDYETSTFGFGRRICPGIPFAERTIWIAVAMILWTFNIEKAKDPKTGKTTFQYSDGDDAFKGDLTNAPYDFPAMFFPRSSQHAEVARQEWEWCEKDLNAILPASTAT